MSDHEAIVFNLSILDEANLHLTHKVFLYHKATMQNMKEFSKKFQNSFLQSDLNSKSVEIMWIEFKEVIYNTISEYLRMYNTSISMFYTIKE